MTIKTSSRPDLTAPDVASCEYLVAHGKGGGFGRFAATHADSYRRGERVIVRSQRGLELGTVLCPATSRHVGLLANTPVGTLVRRAGTEDSNLVTHLHAVSQQVFQESRELAASAGLALEILDVDILMDGSTAILQYLGSTECDVAAIVDNLRQRRGLTVMMENLATPGLAAEEEHAGCGKPDCGKSGEGGCTSCGTGGGCSSCGSGKVDMTAYFAHLRTHMESRARTPLL